MRARLDAAVEISQAELLVRPVQVIVGLAPAEQQRVDAKLCLDQSHHGYRPALADEDWLLPEPGLNGPNRCVDARAVDAHQYRGSAVMVNDFVRDPRRTNGADMIAKQPADRCGLLVGHQAEAQLGARHARQDRFWSGTLVAAVQAVHVAGRPRPAPLERRVAE